MIDELQLATIIKKCKHLKYKFAGVYAADNFPIDVKVNTFIIVNSDKATQMGTHWLLLCNKNKKILFADPLGFPLASYQHVSGRLFFADLNVREIIKTPLQNYDSNLCGLHCIYIAHYVFSGDNILIPYVNEQELLRFANHFI